jgi:hypothetical protein
MRGTFVGIAAAVGVAMTASAAQAAYFPTVIWDSSQTLTAAQAASFLGAPDDAFTGLGSGWITYDLGDRPLVDGSGQDFNVYEVDNGIVEFSIADILVSADGLTFFNVETTSAPALDLAGDEAHGNSNFRRSFDVGGAVAALGATEFRYLRIDGTSGGSIGDSNGFDLDAVGIVNFASTAAVPEPATWALMLAGFGGVGWTARRRRRRLAAAVA